MSKLGSRMIPVGGMRHWPIPRGQAKGFVVHTPVDVKALRKRLGLNQPDFAARYGLAVGTVRDWEQGRSQPDRPTQVLLRVIEQEPEMVQRVLEHD